MLTSEDLAFFAVVSTSRTLAEAARMLNISPPAVTQRLRALEARAGVRLVNRSGRSLAMTDEGAMVAAHGQIVAEAIEALGEALANRTGMVSGNLRVAAPSGFGKAHVAPVVAEFARIHPRVTVGLDLSDHPSTRLADSYDLVVHIGPPGPLDAIVTTLAENRRIVCASPSYLAGSAPISVPADLVNHRCLALRENEEDVTLWRFTSEGDENAAVRIRPAMSTNDGTIVRDWARAGLGVAIRSEWDVAEDLRAGRLRRILPGWEPPSADVVAMLGARRGQSARTSSFLAMLRKSLSPPPWRRQEAGPHDPERQG